VVISGLTEPCTFEVKIKNAMPFSKNSSSPKNSPDNLWTSLTGLLLTGYVVFKCQAKIFPRFELYLEN